MPWCWKAMKDVVGCDKLREAVKQALIRRFPNGGTRFELNIETFLTEYIGQKSELDELKHLSSPRKRKKTRFPE